MITGVSQQKVRSHSFLEKVCNCRMPTDGGPHDVPCWRFREVIWFGAEGRKQVDRQSPRTRNITWDEECDADFRSD